MGETIFVPIGELLAGMVTASDVNDGCNLCIMAGSKLTWTDIIKVYALDLGGLEIEVGSLPAGESAEKDFADAINVTRDMVMRITRGNLQPQCRCLAVYDKTTYMHSVSVMGLCIFLGIKDGFSEKELVELGTAALMHDIGKACIPRGIVNKPAALSSGEQVQIRTHPRLGLELLKDNRTIPDVVLRSIAQHHEDFCGSGYPEGLKGEGIEKYARIIHICDVFDAVTNARPYHAPISPKEALDYLVSNSGTMFDARYVKILCSILEEAS